MASVTIERAATAGKPPAYEGSILMRPTPHLASLEYLRRGASTPISPQSSTSRLSTSLSKFEKLPAEIVDQILSYLVHPRSRLPGLTEAQSAHTLSNELRRSIKDQEDLTQPPDSHRWAADIFSLHLLSHPFNALSMTSRQCRQLVEGFCSHLVRQCNGSMFNLPFTQLDKYGSKCVYPDMSGIVYRRLWLQHAPRKCIFCYAVLDCYPFPIVKRLITGCVDCFYKQTLVRTLISHINMLELTPQHRISTKFRDSTTSRAPPSSTHPTSEAVRARYGFFAWMWRRWPISSTAPEPSTARMWSNMGSRAHCALSRGSRMNTTSTGRDRT
jgi:hypothetical protein